VAASIASLLGLALLACGSEPAPSADPTSARTLVQGPIVGLAHETEEAHVWKGLPFAAPPVGELRWRAPRPPEYWTETREALHRGSECVQLDMADATELVGSEDCLTLDVYAPRFAPESVPARDARRPVMVWIHGGGNSVGSGRLYDAARLAAEGDVVVVVVQYRLGVLGWLSHPALRQAAGNLDDASGNFGTLDTIRALEWVQENAAALGGDPGNVTVFGESAGGINVFALLLSPRARGLFHRAIAQSGVLFSTTRNDAENFVDAAEPGMSGSANEILAALLVQEGRASDRETAKGALASMEPADVEAYLRGKQPGELLSVFQDSPMGGMYFSPNIFRDGHVIVDAPPLEALQSAASHNAVPTIVGTNRDETKLFALFTSPHVRRMFGIPVSVTDAQAFDLGSEYGGLLWKAQGADQPATAMQSGGRSDVFGYRFDWDEQGDLLWLDLDRMLGSSHAMELLFVFGFTDLGRFTSAMYADLPSAEQLSAQMRSYWTEFARAGDPGRGRDGSLVRWQPWGGEANAPKYLLFDSEAGGGLRMASETFDVKGVVSRLETDERYPSMALRCETLKELTQFSPSITEQDYAKFRSGACRSDPLPPRTPLGG
jgi:para-nitrobenzyl esterase